MFPTPRYGGGLPPTRHSSALSSTFADIRLEPQDIENHDPFQPHALENEGGYRRRVLCGSPADEAGAGDGQLELGSPLHLRSVSQPSGLAMADGSTPPEQGSRKQSVHFEVDTETEGAGSSSIVLPGLGRQVEAENVDSPSNAVHTSQRQDPDGEEGHEEDEEGGGQRNGKDGEERQLGSSYTMYF